MTSKSEDTEKDLNQTIQLLALENRRLKNFIEIDKSLSLERDINRLLPLVMTKISDADKPGTGWKCQPIGIIHSCYKEKFGIPRQAGLVPEAEAEIEIFSPYNQEEAFRGLEAFSHIWILFFFHAIRHHGWKSTVRPPRLGGNQRVGVFTTRSGFRPNRIGLSAVKLERITKKKETLILKITGGDFLDDTPILDIKPYLPYADNIPEASGGFASESPLKENKVTFSPEALSACLAKEKEGLSKLRRLIVQILANDPRPGYFSSKSSPSRNQFGFKLYDVDVKWEVREKKIHVTGIETCGSNGK
ncbi:MAG: tRNA (N6-threonylcarbamoyladenosine(37)-N6)-methyltransferase TrmO [Desulfobacterales bacterium]